MAKLRVRGIAFDMYGTVVDVGGVIEVCKQVTPDPTAFAIQWRSKQIEYTFLRTLMGEYRDFWKVTEEALEFTIRRFALPITTGDRQHLMDAWLRPRPYPEVAAALPRLKAKYPLAILSNGSPMMLRTGLARSGLRPHFTAVLSADAVKRYKPAPQVYQLGPKRLRRPKSEILFVSSNNFDVIGAKNFGLKVCWINRTGAPLDPLGPKPDLVVESFDELAAAL